MNKINYEKADIFSLGMVLLQIIAWDLFQNGINLN
jgi:hypothetical protein